MNSKKIFCFADDYAFSDRPEQKIGHIRADNDNYRWWTTYFPADAKKCKTPAVAKEANHLASIIFKLFPKYNDFVRFCEKHPEARLESSDDTYSFFVNGQEANYWIRCITRFRDYNVYINIFAKDQTE